jgi:hypothetical protein
MPILNLDLETKISEGGVRSSTKWLLKGREGKMMEMMKFRLSFSTAILSLFFVSLS